MAPQPHQKGSGDGMHKMISQTGSCLTLSFTCAVAIAEPGGNKAEEIYWRGLQLGLHRL